MKLFKKCLSILNLIIIMLLFIFIICMQYFPDETSQKVGFRFYIILSDSMEPRIPTYSFVVSKTLSPQDPVPENEVVTFKANRNGEPILLTHYFRHTQTDSGGDTYYRTQPEGIVDQYDPYYTKREDIIGTYWFHIPYIGKLFLFLQSDLAILYYGQLLIILLINMAVKAKWKETNKLDETTQKQELILNDPQIKPLGNHVYQVDGRVINHYWISVRHVQIEIIFFDEHNKECLRYKLMVASKEYIHHNKSASFTCELPCASTVRYLKVNIIKHKFK